MKKTKATPTPLDTFAASFSEDVGYLNFAMFGPIGERVQEEARAQFVTLASARYGTLGGLLDGDARVREAVSEVSGFRPDQVVFEPSTSTGLMQAAFGLSGGIALAASEFPSLPYAVVRAAEARGLLSPQWLDVSSAASPDAPGRVTPGTLKERLTPAVSAVAVSLVDYRTGYLADLEGIRQVIGDRLLIVDAVQGFGVVDAPFEVADVVVSGGQKWVRSGWGTGFMALSDRALERLTPTLSGFVSGAGEWPDDAVDAPPHGPEAFQLGRPDPVAQARFAAGLEAIAEVGVAPIAERVRERAARLIDLADEHVIEVSSPRADHERAGIVVLAPAPGYVTTLTAALHNHGVTATSRGGTVRLSAHVSTSDDTLDALRAAFVEFSATV